jgi:hypothetical protein
MKRPASYLGFFQNLPGQQVRLPCGIYYRADVCLSRRATVSAAALELEPEPTCSQSRRERRRRAAWSNLIFSDGPTRSL